MRTDRSEYRARVTDDDGLTRGKVPSPLLRAIGARPGDEMIFSRTGPGTAVMRISRPRVKTAKADRKKRRGDRRR